MGIKQLTIKTNNMETIKNKLQVKITLIMAVLFISVFIYNTIKYGFSAWL